MYKIVVRRCRSASLRSLALIIVVGSLAVATAQASAEVFPGGWTAPLDSMPSVSAGFLASSCNGQSGYLDNKYHLGIDYPRAAGIAVKAIGPGTVLYADLFDSSGIWADAVFIKHQAADGAHFVVLYGHLNESVDVNQTVTAGQTIGTIADLTAAGDHLHFGIQPGTTYPADNRGSMPCTSWPSANGYVDPLPYLAGSASTPAILEIERTTDPSGVRQVYAATKSVVTEGWWIPGSDGVHTGRIIHIAQNNIIDFDKTNLPNNKQALYTAVPDGVWETWWGPGTGLQSTKIVENLAGVRQVISADRWEDSQYVHRLYILAQDGPYEARWIDGGPGIQLTRKDLITGSVAMTKSVSPNGDDQLYVATPTWVYELQWNGGSPVQNRPIINITQADIRTIEKGDNLSGGGQLLYTATATTVWQSYWLGTSTPSHGTIATGQSSTIMVKKTVTGDAHQAYVATSDHVQEYWWHGTGGGGGELIRIPQSTIKAIDKTMDGGIQQLYTAASDVVWETYWGGGVSPISSVLFRVTE